MILLIRDPFDTLLAEFNRRRSESHTGLASIEDFDGPNWKHFIEKQSQDWHLFYKYYAETYSKDQLFILQYEKLKANVFKELKEVSSFLGLHLKSSTKKCLEERKAGSNKRPKPKTDLKQFFNQEQTELLAYLKNLTYFQLGLVDK